MTLTALDVKNAHDDLMRYIADCRTLRLALIGLEHLLEEGHLPELHRPEYARVLGEHAHRLYDNLEGLTGIMEEMMKAAPSN